VPKTEKKTQMNTQSTNLG